MKQYVIIGNGVAAAACIEGIRSVDPDGSITVVSSENHPVYCRPLISYYLEGKTNSKRMLYRGENFYEKNHCTVLYGKSVQRINDTDKTVLLNDESILSYTELCVATGSSPYVPSMNGIESVPHRYSFMTWDDAEKLKEDVTNRSKVLIVGAGLIGLKCAEGLKYLVGDITVCDLSDRILSSILDTESALIVQKHLECNGIQFLLSDSVDHFNHNTAFMKSGKEVSFDILILAIGVRPNAGLIRDINGKINRGIIVDEHMRTSVSSVYAAGDCTEGKDITIDDNRVLALLPNAYHQGFCAGVNMAGGNLTFTKGFPMNSIGFFGLHLMTAGTRYDGDQGGNIYEEQSENHIKKLFCRNGIMTGFVLVGNTERAGIYTSMIREKTPIDTVNFELLKKSPTSAVYSHNIRRKMFGGVV